MYTSRIVFVLFVAFMSAAVPLQAQDPVFSQFFASPLQINPGFTGNNHGGFIALNYRNQWPAIDQAYVTYSLSYDQFVPTLNSGFGVQVTADDAGRGILRTYRFTGNYAYRVKLGDDLYARLGAEAGFINSNIDWNKLVFLDQIDPEFGFTTPGGVTIPTNEQRPESLSRLVFDAGAGILVYSSRFYGGLSLKHLNNPDMGFYERPNSALERGLPLRITVHAGAEIPLAESRGFRRRAPEYFVAPAVAFIRQGPFTQLNAGALLNIRQFFGGLWYRHAGRNGDAVIFLVGGRYEQIRVGYSYDFSVSKLYSVSGGAHELSVGFTLGAPDKVDINDCFQIFR